MDLEEDQKDLDHLDMDLEEDQKDLDHLDMASDHLEGSDTIGILMD
jgi:hypothetical protein